MDLHDYPNHIVIFYMIGLHVSVYASLVALFSGSYALGARWRRRQARRADLTKETTS